MQIRYRQRRLRFCYWPHKFSVFLTTDSRPRPACFDIPRLNYGKACVKFTKITIKRDHTGGCAALELKSRHSGRDIPLGCFFFHGRDGHGVDMETFLDPASFMSLLKNVFQASKVSITSSLVHLTYRLWISYLNFSRRVLGNWYPASLPFISLLLFLCKRDRAWEQGWVRGVSSFD